MNRFQLSVYRQSLNQLREGSEVLYLKVMRELFQSHSRYEFARILSGHFRSKRYDLALTYADSLSAQKYSDATEHFVANQLSTLVKKYPWHPGLVKTNPEARAIETFSRSEHKCARLNKKFSLYGKFRSPFEYKLNEMRSFIRYTIGVEPRVSQILDKCDFGAGASIGTHGNATHLLRKLSSEEWTVGFGASNLALKAIIRNAQLRELILPSRNNVSCFDVDSAKALYASKRLIIDYNKISFVPKTAITHRAIAVEPLLNGFLQKGIDLELKNRLKFIGIDLRDQSRNQRLAREGSMDDSDDGFVTIDLKSASDSISIGLVRHLLPELWFNLLDSTRSQNYMLSGEVKPYTKFCSMGNGFCFPLETLLFVACCKACGCGVAGTDFSVYGDDIIVRKKYAREVLDLLHVMGFQANSAKTNLVGSFRESCGADWFGGVDVRPYTLDYRLDSIESIFKCLNLTRRNEFTTYFFSDIRSFLIDRIPKQFRFFRPFPGNADSGIDAPDYEFLTSPHCHFSRNKQCWVWKELVHVPVSDRKQIHASYRRDSVDMYALLRGALSEHYKVVYTLRRKVRTTVKLISHGGSTSLWVPQESMKTLLGTYAT